MWKLISFVAVYFLVLPLIVTAQVSGSDGFENPIQFNSLREFLEAILNVVISISFPFVVLAIVYTGYLFVSAGGDEGKLNTAKNMLLWTVIGAMIILGAFVLSNAISGTVDEIRGAYNDTAIYLALK